MIIKNWRKTPGDPLSHHLLLNLRRAPGLNVDQQLLFTSIQNQRCADWHRWALRWSCNIVRPSTCSSSSYKWTARSSYRNADPILQPWGNPQLRWQEVHQGRSPAGPGAPSPLKSPAEATEKPNRSNCPLPFNTTSASISVENIF